ncbi:lipopolysaccharide biosynthesis protein [Blautia sp. An46]|uniref:lipopolysaccharide biosynthesis protein n=1 Tax=Blautia sp. An46 TaxID=1965636 RepID=UPI000B3A2DAC|nr:oligosaccharide flippase family protein [Blautia sp. An46]OUN94008.1 polysaccharide biosynthesis protein [Blautia sp. An46]
MSRFKLFLENILVYGLGGVISKAVPLLMLPIITRLMPDTFYFGLNDISTTIVSFGSAIAVMGMYDAMFRLFFDSEDEAYRKTICSTTLAFTMGLSILVFCILIIFRETWAQIFFSDRKYTNLLVLSAMSILIGATNSIVSAPTRMRNQRKVFLVTNTLSPIISYAISIPLLVKGMYVIALPLAAVVSALTIEIIFAILNHSWFSIKRVNFSYLRPLLAIAIPLFPNFLVYWVFNSCDRLMISQMLGMDYNGIYAIGGKVGQVSQLIYTAFAGGWQFFAFSTMKDKDQVDMTSHIFEYLAAIAFGAGILMAACSKTIFRILFTGDYVQGYTVAPYLFLAPLMLMLFQVIVNQFIVIKKTWYNLLALVIGALVNVVLNYILIPLIGIEGAAIGTLVGYIVSIVITATILIRMGLLRISYKFYVLSFSLLAYFLLWRFAMRDLLLIPLAIAIFILVEYCFLFRKDIKQLIKNK